MESQSELCAIFEKFTKKIPKDKIFINPSCGLEFLPHAEAQKKLKNMVEAVSQFNSSPTTAKNRTQRHGLGQTGAKSRESLHFTGLTRYEETIKQLDSIQRWLQSLGVDFSSSRFQTYKNNIETLLNYYKDGRVAEFVKLTDFQEIVFSMTESRELGIVHRQLRDVDSAFLRSRLQLVIKGPLLIDHEDPARSTGQARDFLFELLMLAHLKSSGFEVVFDSRADAHCRFESKNILFQCKRPQAKHTLERNFLKAKDQLTKSLNEIGESDSKGVIALAVSKVLNKGKMLMSAKNSPELSAKFDIEMSNIRDGFRCLEKKIVDTRIIGVFYYLNTPASIQDEKQIYSIQGIRVAPTCLPGSADYDFLLRMTSVLDRLGSGTT